MSVAVFVYARADSSRLPGKSFLRLGSDSLIERVVLRAKEVHSDHLAILTTFREVDDRFVNIADEMEVDLIRGEPLDLVHRTLEALEHFQVDSFVRVNADSPFFEPSIVNSALHLAGPHTLISNLFLRSFPYGVSAEIIGAELYRGARFDAVESDLEHVSAHLYRENRQKFVSITQNGDHSHLRLAIDSASDYQRLSQRLQSNIPYWEAFNLAPPILQLQPSDLFKPL